MARKKKRKKQKTRADPEKEGGANNSVTSETEGNGGSEKQRPRKEADWNEVVALAKAESALETEPDTKGSDTPPAALPSDAQVEDLDAALDLDADSPEDVQRLVAEVGAVHEQEDDAGPLEDLDAELEDPGELQRLIAETVAGAEPEDQVEKPSAEPLDDEIPIEVRDDELAEEVAIVTASAAAPAAPPRDGRLRPRALPEAGLVDTSPGQELEGAIDLGPDSTPELRDRLLAQALAHAEMQEASYRVLFAAPRRVARWKGILASVLLLVAMVILAAPPGWVLPQPPAQIDPPGRARSIRAALLLQAQQVDAYRVRFQRLPDSLDELPGQLPGVRFVKSGSRAYQLIAYESDGNAIVYDSSNPGAAFERLVPSWAAGAEQ